jgi:hypothetical protein
MALTPARASATVVVRRCPDCGGPLAGRPGLEWFVCPGCPLAVDLHREPMRRMKTWLPATATATAPAAPDTSRTAHLPFFAIRLEDQSALHWVHATRILGLQLHGDAGVKLTALGYAPELREWPLRARLARGPGDALRLLQARTAGDATRAASIQLVGLPATVDGSSLREPVSGLVYPLASILPNPLEGPRLG